MQNRREVMHDRVEEKTLGQLFGDLASETSELLRHEVRLAKTEMTEKAKVVGKDVGMMAAGGLVAYAGLLAVVAGIVVLLGSFIPMWLSALLVGLAVIGVGYVLFQKGFSEVKRGDPVLHQTVHTLKEDKRWIQEQMK